MPRYELISSGRKYTAPPTGRGEGGVATAARPFGSLGFLKRDRAPTIGGLIAVAALAWAYLLWLIHGPAGGDWPALMAMPQRHGWSAGDLILTFAMWAVMMAAMMTPSAAPIVLLHVAVRRRRGHAEGGGMALLLGYLLAWAGFSLAATAVQYGLHEAALLGHAMGTLGALPAASVLALAGLYQFSPLKRACLRACRSPLEVLSRHWQSGPLAIGLRHGVYCLGCCWLLMGVLFVVGVMNLVWVAAIALLVLAERLLAGRRWAAPAIGAALIGWSVALAGYAVAA